MKLYFSSPVAPERIYFNQTQILTWLKSLGHSVEFLRDYEGAPRPERRRHKVSKPPITTKTSPLAEHVGKACPYCEREMETAGLRQPTRDHKVPRSRGGKLNAANKLVVCRACNEHKDDRTLEEWHEDLKANGDLRHHVVGRLLP